MYLPATTYMYEFLIVVLVFLLLMMNALATFVPRYTLRGTKRKCKEDADREQYSGQAHGHSRFTGLFSAGRGGDGEPPMFQDQYDV